MTTLGEEFALVLTIAVERGLISQAEKEDWVAHPPPNQEQADHRRFIVRLVREAQQ